MNKSFRLLLFLVLSIAMVTCKDDYNICDQSKNVFFKAGFYNASTGVDSVHTAPSFSFAVLGNNYIYKQQSNISTFVFSLNSAVDSASYFISLSNTLPADTLTLVYTTQSMLISPECGSVFINTITRVYSTSHTIDSVKISNPAVNLASNENVKIYF